MGTASEADVISTKTNRKRFGQEVPDEEPEEEEDPKPDGRGEPWTDEDDRQLTELFNTHSDPTPAFFAKLMEKNKNTVYKHGIQLGFEWKKQKSGPKPILDVERHPRLPGKLRQERREFHLQRRRLHALPRRLRLYRRQADHDLVQAHKPSSRDQGQSLSGVEGRNQPIAQHGLRQLHAARKRLLRRLNSTCGR